MLLPTKMSNFSKASFSIVSAEERMMIFFFKDVHSPKVLSLIASSEERVSKVISDDNEHSLKARFSILLTEEGMIIRANDEH